MKKFVILFGLFFVCFFSKLYCGLSKNIDVNFIKTAVINQNPYILFDTTKPSIIFWVANDNCMSCGVIPWINYYANQAKELNINANILTIIDTDTPDDDLVYKQKLKTSIFILDQTFHLIKHNIVTNNNRTSLIIINPKGEILYRMFDSEKKGSKIELTDHIPTVKTNLSNFQKISSIRLIENDSVIITNITQPYYLKSREELVFCDLTLNKILIYSETKGNIKKIILPPNDFKHYFSKKVTNTWDTIAPPKMDSVISIYIDSMQQHIDSVVDELVYYHDLFINGSDTVVIAEFWSTFYNEKSENKWIYTKGFHWLKYSNSIFQHIENESKLLQYWPIHLIEYKPFSENELLCRFIIPKGKKDTLNAMFRSEEYEFIKLNTQDWTMTKFFKYKDFNPEYTGPDDYIPNITKYATNGNSEFVAFDYATKKAKVFHEDSLIAELPTDILKKYRKDEKDFIILNDLFLTKDKAALIFSKNKDDSATLQIMLIYDRKGNLLIEGTYEKVDKLMETYCLDLDDKGLILLNKWKKNRWTIDSFGFN